MEQPITVQRFADKVEDIGTPYEKALKGDTHGLKRFYQNKPTDALFDQITASRDTVFHIAAYKGKKEALGLLLKMVPPNMKIELLKMKNIHGNTILHEVATTGNIEAAEYFARKLVWSDGPTVTNIGQTRKQILGVRNNLGETPLFRAAEFGKTEMVKYLSGKVEEVGDLHDHYRRDDGATILHSAVIGQHFDTAIWLLNKDPQLANYKDKNGNTALHFLAKLPTAFKGSYKLTGLRGFIYHCFPSHLDDDIDNEGSQLSLSQIEDLESGKLSQSRQHLPSRVHLYLESKMNRTICSFLVKKWEKIREIWKSRKTHTLAVKLAEMLVKTDTSWFVAHDPDEDTAICLERYGQDETGETIREDQGTNTSTASLKKRCQSQSPDTPLLVAAKNGILEIVRLILDVYPQAVENVNQKGHNILHVSILHRQFKIYEFVINDKEEAAKKLVLGINKSSSSTILHHAASTKYYHGGLKPTPALQLQEELTWFKTVQKRIPEPYRLHRNKDNCTAKELFYKQHLDQLKHAQDWVKNTCQSSSTVAVLVATVVFAAAYTAPGGFHTRTGRPILLDKEKSLYWFFTVMDIASLASSLTSVVVFLSILTSSLELQEFAITIPRKLSFGFIFLFFSVTGTMLTFTATIFLVVKLERRWTTSLTYAAALLPIYVFAVFQFQLYYEFLVTAVKATCELIKKMLPG